MKIFVLFICLALSESPLPESLKTARLELKQVSVQWLEEIFAENQGNVQRYFYKFDLLGDLQTWINENRRLQENGQKMEMVILEAETQEFLGMVSLQRIKISPELGIWVKQSAQGKGIGKEALSGLVDWYKAKNGLEEKIHYLVEEGNFASLKLAKSLKMVEEEVVVNPDGVTFQQFVI